MFSSNRSIHSFAFAVFAVVFSAYSAVAQTPVRVNSYSFDGSTLTGTITLYNYAFAKTVTVIYANRAGSWTGSSCAAGYSSGPNSSNYEIWSFNCAIGSAGISQFYVSYTVSGTTYYDNNGGYGVNYQVAQPATTTTTTRTTTSAGAGSSTTTTSTTAPTGSSTGLPGLAADISSWLAAAQPVAQTRMLANINAANTLPGVVIAAPQAQPINQNYFFHWIRDAGLVMDVVRRWYDATRSTTYQQLFFDHRDFSNRIQNIGTISGLGQAKVNVDGTDFTAAWCRPQNDGPALRASSFIRFFNTFLSNGGSFATAVEAWNGTRSVIKPDLEYISRSANYFDSNNCDLWEENRGIHFFTLMAQRKALLEGAQFAQRVGDTGAVSFYNQQAAAIQARINSNFFTGGTIMATQNGRRLDSAIALGVLVGYNNDGFYAPNDEKVLVSLFEFAKGFATEYALNSRSLLDNNNLSMSYAIGRYYGDTYNGIGHSQGNPWYLCTLAFAEVYYLAAKMYLDSGSVTVTSINQPFFVGARPAGLAAGTTSTLVAGSTYARGTPQFNAVVSGLVSLADTYVRRVKNHIGPDYRINEQYSRNDGFATGVSDLTWSYAALTTANLARQSIVNSGSFAVPARRRRRNGLN